MGMSLSFLLKTMQWSGLEHFAGGMHGFLMDETQGREYEVGKGSREESWAKGEVE